MSVEELKKYYIKNYEELLNYISRRLENVKIPRTRRYKDKLYRLKTIYAKKIETTYNILYSELTKLVRALEVLQRQNTFYKELFKMNTGHYPEDLLRYYRVRIRILKKIYNQYIVSIKSSTNEYEAKILYRSAIGRMLSIVKRRKRLLEKIKESLRELSKMPVIRDDEIKVIVAGMPQVGKSTLVSKLSTAKPEIASYPFTTKNIIIGHMIKEPDIRIAFIDTPGILDRPISERNPIELRAIYAIKYLADYTIYLIDVSPNAYYTLDEQLNVLNDVMKIVGTNILVCINKIDITPKESIEKVKQVIGDKYKLEVILISAKEGYGVDKLLNKIISVVKNKNIESN